MSGGSLSPEIFERDVLKAKRNFDVVQSSSTTLLVDLDTTEAKAQFARVLPIVRSVHGVSLVQQWASKSGNLHVLLTLSAPLPFTARVALQAALGSDGKREALAVRMYANGCVEPSVLFRPRNAAVELVE